MKELLTLSGGYPRQQDFLLTLQSELLSLTNGLFAGLNVDLILSGCTVTNNGNGTVSISPGLVYVSGEALRFDGANNVTADGTKAFVKGGYATSGSKQFADGSVKDVYREAKAVIANATGSAAEIKVRQELYGLKNFIEDVLQKHEVKGTIKEIFDFDGTFPANFDSSGLGVTPRWTGWHLLNKNAGLPFNPEGRTLITVGTFTDPVTGKEYTYYNGDVGGEPEHKLTIAELPEHDHAQKADIYNNAAAGSVPPAGQDGNGNRGRTGKTGGNEAHNNMMPYLAVYRVIKVI